MFNMLKDIKRNNRWLEPIGLALLLVAFGWQCWEEQANQMKMDGYFYEMDQKLGAIWMGIYDEALHSNRYHGQATVSTNYDVINARIQDWGQIQDSFSLLEKQTSFFFWARIVMYCIGSFCVILAKWPTGTRQHE